ncbi:hypothetical protein ASD01_29510 [Ensifer sp. Root423]|uniref:hypothetical protein n=1 Tax=Ensifer sp. Root423 TaxID=1736534 RepID=UPI000715FD41|nr:hypothetical protein [Ensifer sp. Root423]KQX20957.1 hypothetical protein ASD01_29510 [Ensifer sp. Root423]
MTSVLDAQPLFALVAALWVATNVTVSASQAINERRDAVLLGRSGDQALSIRHRRLIMKNDWLPMTVATGIACIVFGVLLAIAPTTLNLSPNMSWLCYVLCLVPGIGAISLLYGGAHEYRLMKEVLAAEENVRAHPPAKQ